jgi:hypothetical protein
MKRLAVVALFAIACGATQAQAQTLSLAYSKGATYTYKAHMALDETVDLGAVKEPVTVDMTATETETVQSVDSSGVADISIKLTGVTVKTTVAGQVATTTTTVPTEDIKVGSDGRVLGINGLAFSGGSPFGAAGGGGTGSAIFPDGTVKPGDTWSKNYDQTNPLGSGSVHVTTTSKYLRDETINGTQTAVVQTTINTPMDMTIDFSKFAQLTGGDATTFPITGLQGMAIKGTQVANATTWLDAKGHRVVKSTMSSKIDATFSFVMAAGSSMPGLSGPFAIKGTQTMDLTAA